MALLMVALCLYTFTTMTLLAFNLDQPRLLYCLLKLGHNQPLPWMTSWLKRKSGLQQKWKNSASDDLYKIDREGPFVLVFSPFQQKSNFLKYEGRDAWNWWISGMQPDEKQYFLTWPLVQWVTFWPALQWSYSETSTSGKNKQDEWLWGLSSNPIACSVQWFHFYDSY